MNNDFDNEIDALLRKSANAYLAGATDVIHLDADEISAFAENALPAAAQSRYTEHLADCDPCRKTLSEVILYNAESAAAEPVRQVVAAPAAKSSWYQKLFSFPNLAYGMGALLLVFTGITAFTLLQPNRSGIDLAMANTASKEAPPTFDSEAAPRLDDTLEEAGANSNSESLSNSSAVNPTPGTESGPLAGTLKDAAPGQDSDSTADRPGSVLTGRERDDKATDNRATELSSGVRSAPPAPAEPVTTSRSPAKPKKSTIITERGESADEEAVGLAEARKESSSFREVSGKSFNRKADGVWYDSAYDNQRTTNIARGSNSYKNLDRGLRVIAEEFTETVVVVWGTRAYRIK